MDSELTGLVVALLGVLTLPLVSIPITRVSARGEAGPSSATGIRTRHTTASPEAWRAGHAAALTPVTGTGWVAAAAVAGAVTVQYLAGGPWGVGVALAGLAIQTCLIVAGTLRADHAARRVQPSG